MHLKYHFVLKSEKVKSVVVRKKVAFFTVLLVKLPYLVLLGRIRILPSVFLKATNLPEKQTNKKPKQNKPKQNRVTEE